MTTLDKIKAEIQKVLDAEGDSENAKAQAIALNWVLELFDKYAEQEPCRVKNELNLELNELKPCDDVVSRQAVLEQINCWIGSGEYRYTNATDYLNKRIKALQAVNSQENVGYWMPIEYPTGVEAFGVKEMSAQELQCSECGKTVDISDGDFKYCPYCNTKMVEPRESEDKG